MHDAVYCVVGRLGFGIALVLRSLTVFEEVPHWPLPTAVSNAGYICHVEARHDATLTWSNLEVGPPFILTPL